jgi:hypothetical protein
VLTATQATDPSAAIPSGLVPIGVVPVTRPVAVSMRVTSPLR